MGFYSIDGEGGKREPGRREGRMSQQLYTVELAQHVKAIAVI